MQPPVEASLTIARADLAAKQAQTLASSPALQKLQEAQALFEQELSNPAVRVGLVWDWLGLAYKPILLARLKSLGFTQVPLTDLPSFLMEVSMLGQKALKVLVLQENLVNMDPPVEEPLSKATPKGSA